MLIPGGQHRASAVHECTCIHSHMLSHRELLRDAEQISSCCAVARVYLCLALKWLPRVLQGFVFFVRSISRRVTFFEVVVNGICLRLQV